MLHDNTQPTPPESSSAAPFWTLFDQSRIPMALVDEQRRYVKVNDALVELYRYPRAELIGMASDHMVLDGRDLIEARWQRLLRTNQLYGERLVKDVNGARLQVSYAAQATTLDGRWMALIVTLSARFQPDGPELIGTSPRESPRQAGSKLTAREREVVRLVALGSNSRAIAAELSLSPDTIRSHVRNAMAKTGAHTRAHLVALALADGLIRD